MDLLVYSLSYITLRFNEFCMKEEFAILEKNKKCMNQYIYSHKLF